jgi:hypothetical protein
MAENENKIPATSLAGLEKFAGVVFEGSQGKYMLDEFAYFDDTSLFSTGSFPCSVAGGALVAGVIPQGSEVGLFTTPVGAIGQGFATPLTEAETNLERGAQGGKFPANIAYVALAGGFNIYMAQPAGAAGLLLPVDNPNAMFQIASNFVWSWNVGGESSARLRYEPLKLWPCAAGVASGGVNSTLIDTAAAGPPIVITNVASRFLGLSNGGPASTMRKFAFPLFFPPNVAVDCRITAARMLDFAVIAGVFAAGQGLLLSAGDVRIAMHLRGYKLSRPV